jgi:tight adherence protein B
MQTIFVLVAYGLLFFGAFCIADATAGLIRSARGMDEEAVERRLVNQAGDHARSAPQYNLLLRQEKVWAWTRFVPLFPRFLRLLQTSGTGLSTERAFGLMAVFSALSFVPLAILLPAALWPVTVAAAVLTGPGLVLMYLTRTRAKRIAKFEEQLPDAIDLIVRSLKVGHPLSGAMAVVGRELPVPICMEFATAFEEVSYGQDIPTAFGKMIERVPVADLGYLSMAVQIQQESGGNLVESLAKLSTVIRERFRMFRKVKALTAEGRFSAWFLSIFPLVLVFGIQLVKPDYYTQVMDVPIFPQLVAATVILLMINVVAMRVITNIKV